MMNPWLKNYGHDRFTFTEDMYAHNTRKFAVTEAPVSHGYPYTGWMQVALVYGIGLYTAKEQGIVKKGVYFQRYWRAHYFDWLLFGKRALIFGWAGGLVVGTYMFGNYWVALKRMYSKYRFYMCMPKTDPYNRDT
jgi:hypothetical protein